MILKKFNVSVFIQPCRKGGRKFVSMDQYKNIEKHKEEEEFLFLHQRVRDLWGEVSTKTYSSFEIPIAAATNYNVHISDCVWREFCIYLSCKYQLVTLCEGPRLQR